MGTTKHVCWAAKHTCTVSLEYVHSQSTLSHERALTGRHSTNVKYAVWSNVWSFICMVTWWQNLPKINDDFWCNKLYIYTNYLHSLYYDRNPYKSLDAQLIQRFVIYTLTSRRNHSSGYLFNLKIVCKAGIWFKRSSSMESFQKISTMGN